MIQRVVLFALNNWWFTGFMTSQRFMTFDHIHIYQSTKPWNNMYCQPPALKLPLPRAVTRGQNPPWPWGAHQPKPRRDGAVSCIWDVGSVHLDISLRLDRNIHDFWCPKTTIVNHHQPLGQPRPNRQSAPTARRLRALVAPDDSFTISSRVRSPKCLKSRPMPTAPPPTSTWSPPERPWPHPRPSCE